ncbi:hypothetical protein H8B15_19480 [Hymenobacter sp. BT507]|uniref:Translocation/assembly module TamB n=1 Tax=Hymenobacter citatus TaxID=2763506 RepID=A0ABR7MPV0_9BACT|nr:hypothetical protein [Hymenobacter citatus]MBC6613114.1 hypothetical protein [Hymenobacter citatus]
MKKQVLGWLCAVMVGLGAPAWAQQTRPAAGTATPAPRFVGKLSSDPAQFMQDVQVMMASTNNAAAKASAARLQELWASNRLTATQQGKIVTLSQQMLAKNFKPRPHLETLYNLLVTAKTKQNFSDQQTDELLDVLTKTVDKDAPRDAEKFLLAATQFIETRYLYHSRYSTLRADGGSFSFAYNEADMPAVAEALRPTPKPVAPKPEPAKPAPTPAKAAAKPVAKAKPAPKKKVSSGWDTSDLWSSSDGSGWGDTDDGWGTPVKKKTPAKPAAAAKATPAKEAAAPEPEAEPEPESSAAPSYVFDSYMAPSTKGPVLVLKDVDLYMASGGDSVVLRKTSGAVVPSSHHFVGGNGEFAWTVNNSPATAVLGPYDFDINKAEFKAEPVKFTYAAVLEEPILGALAYKLIKKKPGATDTGYPRFISLTNDARVKDLGQDIRYYGGFSLAGSRMLSASLDGSLSRILVDANGKPKFRASSKAYVLGDTLISAARAAVTIFEDKTDSLTHPGVKMKFSKPRQLLQLTREAGLYKNTPYYDSYHQMEIGTELVTWPLNSPDINFSMLTAKNQVTADFESREFYTNTRYQQIKAINKLHPLQMVVGYSQRHNNQKLITVQEIAQELNIKEPNVRTAAAGLARDSYVRWRPETDEIVVLPKATHYVNSARNKKDYDHLAIKSLAPKGNNATLNLNTNDLLVRGVERFNFSDDSVTVYVKPDSSIIHIQKNRGVVFNGTVVASAFVFKGQKFKFDYDGFYIDLTKIDSIIVKGKGAKGSVMKARVRDFSIANQKGESAGKLYINSPDNKSGRKKLGAYPAFDASTGAAVFFNNPDVLGGAYDSTMYFDIPPFRIDSLNNRNRSAVGFTGTFHSGGIMPDFKTKLSLQEDGALGFTYDVPKEGFPLYGGKGVLFNKVNMSNRGLLAKGNIKYLTGDFSSDQFIFYKDSVVTVGKTGTITPGPLKGVEFAKVTLQPGYQMKWAVLRDSMYLSTQRDGDAMRFYDGNYKFKGTATLTPGGLYGNGGLDGPQSFIRSPQLAFKTKNYTGKQSTLSIKSAEPNKPALVANEVAFEYDLQKGFADFTREEGSKASIELPYSDYRTTLSGGRWDFQKKLVQMRVAPGADSSRSYFYSTKPEQNGLKFRASTGNYDLSRYRLVAGGVPRIASADAWITPDSSKVYILANAQMRPFQNAGIVMDTLAKYHNLYQGAITIQSRTAFSGNAMFKYQTAADSFAIKFSNFHSDSTAMRGTLASTAKTGGVLGKLRGNKNALNAGPASPPTIAVGGIQAADKFLLAPRISYRGSMIMNSQQPGFTFEGQARLQFSQLPGASDWFAVKDSIDPKDVRIHLNEPKTEDGTPMLTGLFLSSGSSKIYPLFVAAKHNADDLGLFTVDGELRYNSKKRDFTISRHDPAATDIYEGDVLTFNDTTAAINFRGKLNLINSNKDYTLVAAGLGYAKPDSAIYQLNTMLGFDINMPDKAVQAMADDIAKNAKFAPQALDGSREDLYKIGEFAGNSAAVAFDTRKGNNASLLKVSNKFTYTILLNKVNLVWSEKQKAWYSEGKIGVANIMSKDLNVLIDGYVEIRKDENGDVVELYLEAEPQTWYYLKYANNLLLTKAQHGSYDELIGQKAKGDYNTATSYGFFLGDDLEVESFLTHFRKDYLGETGKRKVVVQSSGSTGNFDFAEDPGKKKKKKKGQTDEVAADGSQPADEAPMEEPSKKKKKAKEEVAADATNADAPPAEESKKDKKKKETATEAKPDEPKAEDDKKKKKKRAANDPFGED